MNRTNKVRSKQAKAGATMDDIARLTRLSKMTVSRALASHGYVSEKNRQKVLDAARQLNYEINFIGRQLSSNRTRLIGLITSFEGFAGTYYFGRILEGIQQGLSQTDHHITLFDSDSEDFNDGPKCAKLCHQRRVDALAILAPQVNDSFIKTFYELNVPMIVVGSSPDHQDISFVDVDNFGASCSATEHLIHLGHRKIGFFRGPSTLSNAVQRELAFRKTMLRLKIPLNEKWIVDGKYQTRLGFHIALEMLGRKDRPTALFCANDEMAFGVMDAARSLGLKIPSELSLVGFDDIRGADTASPPLTTVRQPTYQLGKTAARYLLDVLSDFSRHPILHEKLSAQLVVRSSTTPPASVAARKRIS